jgi:hypothetical protein
MTAGIESVLFGPSPTQPVGAIMAQRFQADELRRNTSTQFTVDPLYNILLFGAEDADTSETNLVAQHPPKAAEIALHHVDIGAVGRWAHSANLARMVGDLVKRCAAEGWATAVDPLGPYHSYAKMFLGVEQYALKAPKAPERSTPPAGLAASALNVVQAVLGLPTPAIYDLDSSGLVLDYNWPDSRVSCVLRASYAHVMGFVDGKFVDEILEGTRYSEAAVVEALSKLAERASNATAHP